MLQFHIIYLSCYCLGTSFAVLNGNNGAINNTSDNTNAIVELETAASDNSAVGYRYINAPHKIFHSLPTTSPTTITGQGQDQLQQLHLSSRTSFTNSPAIPLGRYAFYNRISQTPALAVGFHNERVHPPPSNSPTLLVLPTNAPCDAQQQACTEFQTEAPVTARSLQITSPNVTNTFGYSYHKPDETFYADQSKLAQNLENALSQKEHLDMPKYIPANVKHSLIQQHLEETALQEPINQAILNPQSQLYETQNIHSFLPAIQDPKRILTSTQDPKIVHPSIENNTTMAVHNFFSGNPQHIPTVPNVFNSPPYAYIAQQKTQQQQNAAATYGVHAQLCQPNQPSRLIPANNPLSFAQYFGIPFSEPLPQEQAQDTQQPYYYPDQNTNLFSPIPDQNNSPSNYHFGFSYPEPNYPTAPMAAQLSATAQFGQMAPPSRTSTLSPTSGPIAYKTTTTSAISHYNTPHKGLGHYAYSLSKPVAINAPTNAALQKGIQTTTLDDFEYLQMPSDSFELPSYVTTLSELPVKSMQTHYAFPFGLPEPGNPTFSRQPHAYYGVPFQTSSIINDSPMSRALPAETALPFLPSDAKL